MSNSKQRPTYVAFVVEEGGENQKGFWHRVGVVFPHRAGDGLTLVIPPGLSLSGRVQLMVPKDADV
jgi:hypothetical protein